MAPSSGSDLALGITLIVMRMVRPAEAVSLGRYGCAPLGLISGSSWSVSGWDSSCWGAGWLWWR